MKRYLRSKLVLRLATIVMIAAVVAIPLSGNINRSHAASSKIPSGVQKLSSSSLKGHRVWAGSPTGSGAAATTSSNCAQPCDLIWGNGASRGPVQKRPVAYIIFWGSYWLNNQGKLRASGQLVVNYFHDVGGTSFEKILTQYYDATAHIANTESLADMWVDTSPPPTTTGDCIPSRPDIHDSDIRVEIDKAIQTKGWPKNNPNVTYFVYTPPANLIYANDMLSEFPNPCNATSSTNNYCAYHYFSGTNQDNTAYAVVIYPRNFCQVPMSPNNNLVGDSLVDMTAHEQFEAITDPNGSTGWVDGVGQEIGDKCETDLHTLSLNNGGVFEIQSMYSNASHACVTSYAQKFKVSPGAVKVTTTLGANPASQTLTIQNSGNTLNWQVNTGVPSWLTVTPASGSISARSSSAVTLTFDTSQYAPQTLFTALIFSDTYQSTSSFQVPITVVIIDRSSSNNDQLNGIAAVSANDVWAVGTSYTNSTGNEQTLIEHWNGSTWNVVPSPNPGVNNILSSVAPVSANDVWAVGLYDVSVGNTQALIEHWNGSTWYVVPSPNPGDPNILSSVAAVSANDIWAVGNYGGGTFIEHWDGNSWNVVSSPNPGANPYGDILDGVGTVSANDVWAVGYSYDVSQGSAYVVIEHWDGTSWNSVSSPTLGGGGSLSGIAAVSSSDVWAIGVAGRANGGNATLSEHWDGTSWDVVYSPNPSFPSGLLGVAVVSANDVWAVGSYATSVSTNQGLIEHWDGNNWNVLASPNLAHTNGLSSVAVVSANDVWAVGTSYTNSTGNEQTLIEHWNGSTWNVVPSPNP